MDFPRRCERTPGRIIPRVFHLKGEPVKSVKGRWRRACEKAGVSRSVATKMTGHKTESVYRRYAIVSEVDLKEAGAKLASLRLKGWVSDPVQDGAGQRLSGLYRNKL